jgi:hypothetical protein
MPNTGDSATDGPIVLTASEIGSFAFCPQAWYLQRRRAPRTAIGGERIAAGTVAHQRIGRQTDQLREVERARNVLAVIILVLLVVLALQMLAAVLPLAR